MIVDIQLVVKRNSTKRNNVEKKDFLAMIPGFASSVFEATNFFAFLQHQGVINETFFQRSGISVFFIGNIYLKNDERHRLNADKKKKLNAISVADLYSIYGENCITLIKGSFVLFLFDETNKTSYVFNDRMGLYELFYHVNNHQVYISTNLLAFNLSFNLNLDTDKISLQHHFLFDYPLSDDTFLESVKSLQPGTYIKIIHDSFEIKRYHSYVPEILKEAKFFWEETLRQIPTEFNKAIDVITEGETSICAGLTSGFDSRTNLSRLVNYKNKDILYYSWGLPASIELKVAKEITDKLKQKYRAIFLLEDFEGHYERFAHQSVLLSNGKATITRANHSYGYHLLKEHSSFFLTGIVGSELLKPRNVGGYMFTQLFIDLLYSNSKDARRIIFENHLLKYSTIIQTQINQKNELMERTLAYFEEFDTIEEPYKRLYYFMLKDGFRNYFGHEVHSNRIYGTIISPYADDDFIEFLLKTPIPGLNKFAFKNDLKSKIMGSRVYLPIMKANTPALLNIETGRFIKPKNLDSGCLYYFLAKAKIKKFYSPKNDTFDTIRWSTSLLKKNEEILNGANFILKDNKHASLSHKDIVKLYSMNYFLDKLK